MTPAGPTRSPAVPATAVDHLLFVVDTVNCAPGASGRFAVEDIRIESTK